VEDHANAAAAYELLDTEDELIIHPLTLSECAVGPARSGQLATFRRQLVNLGVEVWQPDNEHYFRMASLRASTTLKLPDCCVVDCARTKSATLATFDVRLAAIARSLGVTVAP